MYLQIPFPHTFSMRRSYVFINNMFPTSTTEPTTKKTLNLFNLSNVGVFFYFFFALVTF